MKRGYAATYLKIILIILVIVAIGYGVFYYLKDQYQNEKYETIKTDMLLIENRIEIIEEKVKIKEKDISYVGTKIAEMQEDEEIKKLIGNGTVDIESKDHNYYVLNKVNLEELKLTEIQLEEGYYIVDYKTGEVIYSAGIKDNEGNLIYKLSEIKSVE